MGLPGKVPTSVMLSDCHGRKSKLLQVSIEILGNQSLIEYYFDLISYMMNHDEFEKVEELLTLAEECSQHKIST